jgi:hypothetical protein
MPPVEFEPTISAGERPQIYALHRAPRLNMTIYLQRFHGNVLKESFRVQTIICNNILALAGVVRYSTKNSDL